MVGPAETAAPLLESVPEAETETSSVPVVAAAVYGKVKMAVAPGAMGCAADVCGVPPMVAVAITPLAVAWPVFLTV